MGMRIPQELLDQIRQQVDIVDLISEYVQLKRVGRSFMGLCPFHSEKGPSFSVSQEKQFYHCFGCGAGGNVFTFVMQIEHISFVEAALVLAKRAQIAFEFEDRHFETDELYKKRRRMMDAHELASKFYNYILMNTEVGVQALRYLEHRGLRKSTILEFQLGYAPDSWDTLGRFLLRRGFETDLLIECGLLSQSSQHPGKVFDRFRDRVIFPVHDGQGNCIAFGGRVMAKGEPKYLNSQETPIFHKGRNLFNLHRARPQIRKQGEVLLCEGYLDVITAYQADVQNVVAALGTALTSEQAGILKRNAHKVIMAYDGDQAGINATRKNTAILLQSGLDAKVAVMPQGRDPDEVVQELGAEYFQALVTKETVSSTDYMLQTMRKDYSLSTNEGKSKYVQAAIAYLASVANPIEQEIHLRNLESEFKISMDVLKTELQTQIHKDKQSEHRSSADVQFRNTHSRVESFLFQQGLPAHIVAEQYLLTHMLIDTGVITQVQDIGFNEFSVDEHNALYVQMIRYMSEHPDTYINVASFLAYVQDEHLVSYVTSLLARTEQLDMRPGLVEEYVRRIQLHQYEVNLRELESELIACGNRGDFTRMVEVQREIRQVRQEIQSYRAVGKLER